MLSSGNYRLDTIKPEQVYNEIHSNRDRYVDRGVKRRRGGVCDHHQGMEE